MKGLRKVLILAVVFALVLSTAASASFFQPMSSTCISSCSASIASNGTGGLTISYNVYGTGIMNQIGATNISIYQYYYGSWVLTASFSGSMGYNTSSYGSYNLYSGVDGAYYYAVVTCYAANSSDSETRYASTGAVYG